MPSGQNNRNTDIDSGQSEVFWYSHVLLWVAVLLLLNLGFKPPLSTHFINTQKTIQTITHR